MTIDSFLHMGNPVLNDCYRNAGGASRRDLGERAPQERAVFAVGWIRGVWVRPDSWPVGVCVLMMSHQSDALQLHSCSLSVAPGRNDCLLVNKLILHDIVLRRIGRENGTDAFHEYTTTTSVTTRLSDAPEDWFGQLDARYS